MKRKRGNKKGYTMVELIAVFLLTAILLSSVATMVPSYLRVYTKINERALTSQLSDLLVETISAELSNAADVTISTSSGSWVTFLQWLRDNGLGWVATILQWLFGSGGSTDCCMIVTNAAGAAGSRVVYTNKNGYPMELYLKDGELVLYYQEIRDGNSNLLSSAVEWGYKDGVYGNCRVSQMSIQKQGNRNLLALTLAVENTQTGYTHTVTRYISCYNLEASEIRVYGN